jgi:15-cis-phytoene synthase
MEQVNLYNETSLRCSKLITNNYSTSFSLGIYMLSSKFRMPIYAIYGFVRFADEIVDTFHDKDKKTLLDKFKRDTYEAIESGVSFNPVLHSFQMVVNQNNIDKELIDAFLHSMEMDIFKNDYDRSKFNEYVYGSAEVVGLMCLYVFCEGNKERYLSLKDAAKRLGAAFQKINFLRDIKSDLEDRGRVYFPHLDIANFNNETKLIIEKEIEDDFRAAFEGIKKLPNGSKLGVYIAYIYYIQLYKKIKSLSASKIMNERIRIPDFKKYIANIFLFPFSV